jgi:hypothetical protein
MNRYFSLPYILLGIFLLIAFSTCEKDEFVSVEDINIPQEESIAANLHIYSSSSKVITLSEDDQELIKSSISGLFMKDDNDVKFVIDSILATQALAVTSG